MKGFIGKLVLALGSAGGLSGMAGCDHLRNLHDPCYPERYWHASRQNVNAAFAPQLRNGHVLDQTVWNYHFEDGSEKLTAGGQARLDYIARRRPSSDPCVFLQTAQQGKDVVFDGTKPDAFVKSRGELDQKRIVSVKQYLAAVAAGGMQAEFEVYVHNPPEVGISGVTADYSLRQLNSTPRATLPGTAGASAGGGAGAGGGGSR